MSTSSPAPEPEAVPAESTAPNDNTTDAATRIKTLLRDLLDASEKAFGEIEQIAAQERDRLGDKTPEGRNWNGFAGLGLFSDASAAARNIQLQIASVRGMMAYRGLDMPSPKP